MFVSPCSSAPHLSKLIRKPRCSHLGTSWGNELSTPLSIPRNTHPHPVPIHHKNPERVFQLLTLIGGQFCSDWEVDSILQINPHSMSNKHVNISLGDSNSIRAIWVRGFMMNFRGQLCLKSTVIVYIFKKFIQKSMSSKGRVAINCSQNKYSLSLQMWYFPLKPFWRPCFLSTFSGDAVALSVSWLDSNCLPFMFFVIFGKGQGSHSARSGN